MSARQPKLAGLMLALSFILPALALAHGGPPDPGGADARDVRRATAPYRDVEVAKAAGYAQFLDCVGEPEQGAMGIHYLNEPLAGDALLDPLHPEALMYEPQDDGSLELVGVEYIVFQEPWDAANPQPPVLFGHPFHLVRSPNRYGVPSFYELHLWVWKRNPDGMFNDWNSGVHCP